MRRRREGPAGLTLVELLMGLAIGVVLFLLIVGLHTRGLRILESNSRKMTAIERTHRVTERLRQEFFQTRFAWVVPVKDLGSKSQRQVWSPPPSFLPGGQDPADSLIPPVETLGGEKSGSPLLYLMFSSGAALEVLHDAHDQELFIGGASEHGRFCEVLFSFEYPSVVKYLIRVDESSVATRFPAARERSTVVGASFLPLMNDEIRFAHFVYEPQHRWCLEGYPVQWDDP